MATSDRPFSRYLALHNTPELSPHKLKYSFTPSAYEPDIRYDRLQHRLVEEENKKRILHNVLKKDHFHHINRKNGELSMEINSLQKWNKDAVKRMESAHTNLAKTIDAVRKENTNVNLLETEINLYERRIQEAQEHMKKLSESLLLRCNELESQYFQKRMELRKVLIHNEYLLQDIIKIENRNGFSNISPEYLTERALLERDYLELQLELLQRKNSGHDGSNSAKKFRKVGIEGSMALFENIKMLREDAAVEQYRLTEDFQYDMVMSQWQEVCDRIHCCASLRRKHYMEAIGDINGFLKIPYQKDRGEILQRTSNEIDWHEASGQLSEYRAEDQSLRATDSYKYKTAAMNNENASLMSRIFRKDRITESNQGLPWGAASRSAIDSAWEQTILSEPTAIETLRHCNNGRPYQSQRLNLTNSSSPYSNILDNYHLAAKQSLVCQLERYDRMLHLVDSNSMMIDKLSESSTAIKKALQFLTQKYPAIPFSKEPISQVLLPQFEIITPESESFTEQLVGAARIDRENNTSVDKVLCEFKLMQPFFSEFFPPIHLDDLILKCELKSKTHLSATVPKHSLKPLKHDIPSNSIGSQTESSFLMRYKKHLEEINRTQNAASIAKKDSRVNFEISRSMQMNKAGSHTPGRSSISSAVHEDPNTNVDIFDTFLEENNYKNNANNISSSAQYQGNSRRGNLNGKKAFTFENMYDSSTPLYQHEANVNFFKGDDGNQLLGTPYEPSEIETFFTNNIRRKSSKHHDKKHRHSSNRRTSPASSPEHLKKSKNRYEREKKLESKSKQNDRGHSEPVKKKKNVFKRFFRSLDFMRHKSKSPKKSSANIASTSLESSEMIDNLSSLSMKELDDNVYERHSKKKHGSKGERSRKHRSSRHKSYLSGSDKSLSPSLERSDSFRHYDSLAHYKDRNRSKEKKSRHDRHSEHRRQKSKDITEKLQSTIIQANQNRGIFDAASMMQDVGTPSGMDLRNFNAGPASDPYISNTFGLAGPTDLNAVDPHLTYQKAMQPLANIFSSHSSGSRARTPKKSTSYQNISSSRGMAGMDNYNSVFASEMF